MRDFRTVGKLGKAICNATCEIEMRLCVRFKEGNTRKVCEYTAFAYGCNAPDEMEVTDD
jgi:hypothetical protein